MNAITNTKLIIIDDMIHVDTVFLEGDLMVKGGKLVG